VKAVSLTSISFPVIETFDTVAAHDHAELMPAVGMPDGYILKRGAAGTLHNPVKAEVIHQRVVAYDVIILGIPGPPDPDAAPERL
jgi:hypothetical protein